MGPDYDYTTFPEVVASAVDAYAQAGIKDPRQALARRCSPAPSDLDGELAVNPDGGLKSFGHPIGASGLRMLFEAWLQLRGEGGNARSPPSRAGAGSPSRTTPAAHRASACRSSGSSGRSRA